MYGFLCYCFGFVFYENRDGRGNPFQSKPSHTFLANELDFMGDMWLTCKQQKEFWNSKLYRLQNIDLKNVLATKKIKFHSKIITIVEPRRPFLPALVIILQLEKNNKAASIKGGEQEAEVPFRDSLARPHGGRLKQVLFSAYGVTS